MRDIITFILEKNKILNAKYDYIFKRNKISKISKFYYTF
jgi:hypothetical protein